MTRSIRPRREVVRRRRRERQLLFFGVTLLALAAVFAVALGVYQGRVEAPIDRAFVEYSQPAEEQASVPCPPTGPEDKFPLPNDQVSVRVMNGTETQGLARSVNDLLEGRGFVSAGVTNWRSTYEGAARIQFGEEGLRKAYSLARSFPTFELVYDQRKGGVVDLILGTRFKVTDMRATYAPELSMDLELTAVGQCKPIDQVQPKPAPAVIPVDPLAPTASPSPSASPTP